MLSSGAEALATTAVRVLTSTSAANDTGSKHRDGTIHMLAPASS